MCKPRLHLVSAAHLLRGRRGANSRNSSVHGRASTVSRPAGTARIAEVFLHASAANYNLYKLVGTPTPAGVDTKALEQSTVDKAKVIATLKASYAHAEAAIRLRGT